MNRTTHRAVVIDQAVAHMDFLDDAQLIAEHWSNKIDNQPIRVETLTKNGWVEIRALGAPGADDNLAGLSYQHLF